MADIISFMRQGWKNIWKQELIFLFSALPVVLSQLQLIVNDLGEVKLLQGLLMLLLAIGVLIFYFVSYIGVPYLAWCATTSRSTTIPEVLAAVRKFLWRIIGVSCLIFLLFSPCLILVLFMSMNNPTHRPQGNSATILSLFLSLFAAVLDFALFGFFANDWGIRESLEKAWNLFTSHFGVLAVLGLILTLISMLITGASAALTVLFQSGFDMTSLGEVNYIAPATSLYGNMIFLITSGVGQIILIPFHWSAFASAYLKYTKQT